jgi:hypothetical protein
VDHDLTAPSLGPGDRAQGVVLGIFNMVAKIDLPRNLAYCLWLPGEFMAFVEIPRRFRKGFKHLAGLDEAAYEALLQSLAKVSPSADSVSVARSLPKEVTNLTLPQLQELLDTLSSISFLRDQFKLSPDEVLSEILDTIAESPGDLAGLDDEKLAVLGNRIDELARSSIPSLEVLAKASDLMSTFANTLVDARILSDIRPIFGIDVKDEPAALAIVHTLKLAFHADTGHQEFFVSLRSSDLSYLKSVIDRAMEKNDSLHKMIDRIDKPCLEA